MNPDEVSPLRCQHGSSWRDKQATDGVPMAAPYSTCACCGIVFYYIDSAIYGTTTESHSTTWTPKSRCSKCGGKYIKH